jgi:hypothetical protein
MARATQYLANPLPEAPTTLHPKTQQTLNPKAGIGIDHRNLIYNLAPAVSNYPEPLQS